MSTFVLKREYVLQMPTNYVEIDGDEMEYVEGGFYYLTYSDVVKVVTTLGMTAATVTIAGVVTGLGGAGAVATLLPGIGWAAAGIIAANAAVFGWACVTAITERKGIDISVGLPAGLKFVVE